MRSDVKSKRGLPPPPNRSLLYALGYTEEELNRPLVGVVSSYNEIVPGHMDLDKIVEAVKAGIRAAAEPRWSSPPSRSVTALPWAMWG